MDGGSRARRLWWLSWLSWALLPWLTACSPGSSEGAIHVLRAQHASVPGMGYTAPPVSLDAAGLPPKWQPVKLPDMYGRELVAHAAGERRTSTDWYRLDLRALQASTAPAYMYLPRWKTIGQIAIYGDGRLLYASEGSRTHNGYNHPLLIRLNPGAGQLAPSVVVLRIDRLQSSGLALSTVWCGSREPLIWRYQWRLFLQTQLPFIGGSAFLAVGCFSLAVWTQFRGDRLYLLFFAAAALAFVRLLHYHVGGSHLPVSDEWFEWITVASLMWLAAMCHCFMERLHERPSKGLTPLLFGVTLACNLLTLPGAVTLLPQLTLITPLLYLLLLPFALLIFFDGLRNALRRPSREVGLMAGWMFASPVSCIYDVALQDNLVSPEGMYINPVVILGLFVMILYIMFRRYIGAMREVEAVNASLASQLKAREEELAASYAQLGEIERHRTLKDERLRLTQDMHDGLGSTLVTALRAAEGGRMTDTDLIEVLQMCIADLKLTIDSMDSIEPELLLLLATLRFRLGPRLSAARINLVWAVKDVPRLEWLNSRSALHILRIVQEAIANILKHTQTPEIRVRTLSHGGTVEVSIEDDGTGFDVEAVLKSPTGRGLRNQCRRAESIGGFMQWTSGEAGTRCSLHLPVVLTSPASVTNDGLLTDGGP